MNTPKLAATIEAIDLLNQAAQKLRDAGLADVAARVSAISEELEDAVGDTPEPLPPHIILGQPRRQP
jgi:hypothetical protein